MSEKAPLLFTCAACKHIWPGCWLPIRAEAVGRMSLRCPYCDAPRKHIGVAHEEDLPRYHEHLLAELRRLARDSRLRIAELRRLDRDAAAPPRSDESEAP